MSRNHPGPIDFVLSDLEMPRMDGLEVSRRVRESSRVPIIVLTALDAEGDKVAALDLGADDYLTKPVGKADLLSAIRSRLERAAQPGRRPLRPLRVGQGPQVGSGQYVEEGVR